MYQDFKKGASLREKISISFSEIKVFAIDRYSVSMVKIDVWFVALVLLFSLTAILLFTGVGTSITADYNTAKVVAAKSGDLYDSPLIGETNKKSKPVPFSKVNRGDSLRVLSAINDRKAYQVETADGERGFVSMEVIDDSLVVIDKVTVDAERFAEGDKMLYKGRSDLYRVSVERDGKLFKKVYSSDLMPLKALGVPEYHSTAYTPVTISWVMKRFRPGETKKVDVDKEWYGYARTVKVNGNVAEVEYALSVQDSEKGIVYRDFSARYIDGVLDIVTYSDEKDMDWIMTKLPMVDAIQSMPLSVIVQASDVTTEAEYCKIEDIGDQPNALERWIKENIGDFSMPSWLNIIIGIVMLLILLVVALFVIHCMLLVVPMLVQFVGYARFIPNFIYRILVSLALLFGAELIYVLVGGINWFLLILLIVYLFWQWKQWMMWITFNRCPNCKKMYTLSTSGWGDAQESYYDNVKYNVTTLDGKEIGRYETSREHRKTVAVDEMLSCENCGCEFSYTHVSDMKA